MPGLCSTSCGPLSFSLQQESDITRLPSGQSKSSHDTHIDTALTNLQSLRQRMESKSQNASFSDFYSDLVECLGSITDIKLNESKIPRDHKNTSNHSSMKHIRSLHRSEGLSRRKAQQIPSFRATVKKKLAALHNYQDSRSKNKIQKTASAIRRLYWTSRKKLHRFLDTGHSENQNTPEVFLSS